MPEQFTIRSVKTTKTRVCVTAALSPDYIRKIGRSHIEVWLPLNKTTTPEGVRAKVQSHIYYLTQIRPAQVEKLKTLAGEVLNIEEPNV